MAGLPVLVALTYFIHISKGFHPLTIKTGVTDDLKDMLMDMKHEQDRAEETMANLTGTLNRTIVEIKSGDGNTSSEVTKLERTMKSFTSSTHKYKSAIRIVNMGFKKLKQDMVAFKVQAAAKKKLNESTPVLPVNTEQPVMNREKKYQVCPEDMGFHYVGNICLRLSDPDDVLTWQASRNRCQKDGSDLITFHDTKEERAVLDHLILMGKKAHSSDDPLFWSETNYIRLWVGMKRQMGHFKWISGSTFRGTWVQHAPLNSDKWQCVCVRNTGISDDRCYHKRRYICQIPLEA